ncbi:MAG: hypothetical protein HY331_08880 [Chloroflexi bacterium]|nr:hypothetical protein [Chloroflexota bacterium]
MARIEDFTIRERNVLTLPQGIREVSRLRSGVQGKAVAVGEGIVLLVVDPLLVDDLVERVTRCLDERAARDPWARLNEALAADRLEPMPTERYVAPPEPDAVPALDRLFQQYGDTPQVEPSERRWQE